MRRRSCRPWMVGAMLCVWGVAGHAVAQEVGDQGPPADTEEIPATEGDLPPPPPEAPIPEAPQVSDEQKMIMSREGVARMKAILTKVLGYLSDARDENDVVKLNCINEKLTSIKGLLKISEQADVNLQEAISRRDPDVSQHEFEKIMIATRKCEQLLADSEACVGELAVYSGDTQVEVEVTGAPPDQEEEFFPDLVPVQRPPAASPYQ